MPIARHDGKLIYYAHVPKCAGSSVETYLERRFGPLAFVDKRHTQVPVGERWSATSPQHIDMRALERLFPAGFFDHAFAVVRHPVHRIVSAYHFQRGVERTIPQSLTFSEWLSGLPDEFAERRFAHDNHIRPMSELVPEGAEIFHLEHGLDGIVAWLDGICGDEAGPRSVPRVNERNGKDGEAAEPTPSDLRMIGEIYAADFERFGYTLEQKAPLAAKPAAAGQTDGRRASGTWQGESSIGKIRSGLSRLLRP